MNASDCVELARLRPGAVGLRDSKQGASAPMLTFSLSDFSSLVSAIKRGGLDPR